MEGSEGEAKLAMAVYVAAVDLSYKISDCYLAIELFMNYLFMVSISILELVWLRII